MKFFRKLTYNKVLRELARRLHLRIIFRKIYFFLARPRKGILNLKVGGVGARFFVKTPGELRVLESMGGSGFGEKFIIESFVSKTRVGDVFYDIGGHVGLYTVLLSKVIGNNGKVFTFEPNKDNNEHLLENIKLNSLNNVKAFKKALGEKTEVVKVFKGEDGGNFSLLNRHVVSSNSEMIEVEIGDEFIVKNNLPIPNIIKIDVEGYEYSVIKGLHNTLSDKRCRMLCCEIHNTILPSGVDINLIKDTLNTMGFNKIDSFSRDEENHILAYKNNGN